MEKESKAVSKQANLKLLLKEAQATEGEREKDYAKEEIKSLKRYIAETSHHPHEQSRNAFISNESYCGPVCLCSRIQILIYNLSASEKQLSEFDADASPSHLPIPAQATL